MHVVRGTEEGETGNENDGAVTGGQDSGGRNKNRKMREDCMTLTSREHGGTGKGEQELVREEEKNKEMEEEKAEEKKRMMLMMII